ncbi:MAG: ComF family protein [Moraxellaceae bacterium]|nr:ComF family protein [Moraxellaceae bacterium]
MVYNWLKNNLSLRGLLRPACLLCDAPAESHRLCNGCLHDLPWNLHACDTCALPLPEGLSRCGDCRARAPLQSTAVAPLRYAFPVDGLVSGLKYRRQLAHAPALGELLRDAVIAAERPAPDLLLPVPLHVSRLRERGCNQALELSRPLARHFGLVPETRLLQRERATAAQMALSADARRRNLRRAFTLDAQRLVTLGHPKRIAIVDDVLTTGATVQAIATLLHQHGVEDIEVWVVARTP